MNDKTEKMLLAAMIAGVLAGAEAAIMEIENKTPKIDEILALIDEETKRLKDEVKELVEGDGDTTS
ncbi:MAG: hypothetical protein CMK92_06160 [Pseudomonas sp.]|nr:hypothetical protein [Pseudomonas sp.]